MDKDHLLLVDVCLGEAGDGGIRIGDGGEPPPLHSADGVGQLLGRGLPCLIYGAKVGPSQNRHLPFRHVEAIGGDLRRVVEASKLDGCSCWSRAAAIAIRYGDSISWRSFRPIMLEADAALNDVPQGEGNGRAKGIAIEQELTTDNAIHGKCEVWIGGLQVISAEIGGGEADGFPFAKGQGIGEQGGQVVLVFKPASSLREDHLSAGGLRSRAAAVADREGIAGGALAAVMDKLNQPAIDIGLGEAGDDLPCGDQLEAAVADAIHGVDQLTRIRHLFVRGANFSSAQEHRCPFLNCKGHSREDRRII